MSLDSCLLTLAYGPFPGIELVPYFFGLVAWAVVALLAIFLAPLKALWRKLRGDRTQHAACAAAEPAPRDGGRD